MLTTSLLIGGLAAVLIGLAAAAYLMPARPRPITSARDNPRGPESPHHAPLMLFTEAQAHREMQLHRECRRGDCARKDAAWMVLVDAGRIHPRVPVIGGIR
ncbi:hypothetical protein IRT45_02130 [Nocardia sp. BSTN01]|uniref:hypothetical protein n=1 Tax=Nocardia sp. BSTN01 TaxID=2783665 RepID=UPI00188EE64F|nr:hypothetical protein [Nocardia sp. BSTN01]MBF4995948.1 hypothetical protein [Nocardia sp. BSTN01]